MHLTSLLSLLPLTLSLALPTHNHLPPPTLSQRDTCNAQQWDIQQFTAFTAGPNGAPAGSPNIFNFDHISFFFDDPNFSARAECERSIAKGSGRLADGNFYPCGGFNMSFQYLGSTIELKRTGVECGDVMYTERGATGLSLNCYPLFGGTQCEALTQVNVQVAFLEQTGPAS